MKKVFWLLTSAALLTLLFLTSAFANTSIKVLVNGEKVSFEVSPYVQEGQLSVPVRQLSETLGAKVEWDAEKKTAWVHKGMMHIAIPLGEKELYIHRDADFSGIPQTIKLKEPIKSIEGRTFLPAKVLADCFGVESAWDENSQVFNIEFATISPEEKPLDYVEVTKADLSANETLNSWYEKNNQIKGIHYIRDNNFIYALVCAGEKPSGGYTLEIDSVKYRTPDTAVIDAHVTPPGDNVRVMMMITYPSKLIKIDSEVIKHVEGNLRDGDNPDSKVVWVMMDSTTVKSMELFNLDQKKIKDFSGQEMDKIMNSFNEATLDQNPFIEMITGGMLKVTLTDGRIITFTSYGSKTNVVATFKTGEKYQTYHLVAPEIAQILIEED